MTMSEITVMCDPYAIEDPNPDIPIQVDLFSIADGCFVRHLYKNRTDVNMLLECGYMRTLSMQEMKNRVPEPVWLRILNPIELKTVVLGYMKPDNTVAKLRAAAVLCECGMVHIDIPPLVEFEICVNQANE